VCDFTNLICGSIGSKNYATCNRFGRFIPAKYGMKFVELIRALFCCTYANGRPSKNVQFFDRQFDRLDAEMGFFAEILDKIQKIIGNRVTADKAFTACSGDAVNIPGGRTPLSRSVFR
jgi:hypothetical protein